MSLGDRLFFGIGSIFMIAITLRSLSKARDTGRIQYGHSFGRRLFADQRISPTGFKAAVALHIFIFIAGLCGIVSVAVG